MDPLRKKGRSDRGIAEELEARGFRGFSPEEVRRLGGLKLPPPA
jgi:hypothetical protein